MVEESLRKCRSSFPHSARDPDNSLMIGGNALYFIAADCLRTVDLDTWGPRVERSRSMAILLKLCRHWMASIVQKSLLLYAYIEGILPSIFMLEGLVSRIRNSTRAQVTGLGYLHDSERCSVELAKVAGVDILGAVTPLPSLTLYKDSCESALTYAEAGFPI